MTRALALALALLLSSAGISGARLFLSGGGGTPGSPTTISAISPSSLSFTAPVSGGSPTGITLGLTMTSGSGNGATFALATHSGCTSTDNASFAVPGTALPASVPINAGGSTVNAGSYVICLEATLSGATNSPFFQSFTLTGSSSSPSFVSENLSNLTFAPTTPNAVVGTLSAILSSGSFTGTFAIVSSGNDHNGTPCNTSSGADFQIVSGSTLETNGTGLASGAYSNICASATQGGVTGSPFVQAFNLNSTPAGVVLTELFYNNSSSTSPGSATPVQAGAWFPPGAVASGCRADPSIGGVTLAQWSASDHALTWPDGSERWLSFSGFAPSSLAAGAHETVSWTLDCSGGWPSITPAALSEITSGSDFNVVLTDLTTAYIPAAAGQPLGSLIGMTVSGGSVTATNIRDNPILAFGCGSNPTCGGATVTVQGCSGTAPVLGFVSASNGHGINWPTSVTINTPGSGCPTLGSGTWVFDINDILNGISSVPLCTSMTTNSQVCQYAGDGVKDGFQIWGDYIDSGLAAWAASQSYSSGAKVVSFGNAYSASANCTLGSTAPKGHVASVSDGGCTWNLVPAIMRAQASVEVWKNSGGSTFGYNIAIQNDNALYTPGGSLVPYTFNADFKNGSTEIDGAAASNQGWTGIGMWGDGGAWWVAELGWTALLDHQRHGIKQHRLQQRHRQPDDIR